MAAGILRTFGAAGALALVAGPAAAQWTFNAYDGGAIASVAERDGREFGVECLAEAEDVMRIFVVLRPRGTIRPGRTPFKFSIGRQEYSIEADLEEAAGLALVSVGVGWSGQTQEEARARLRAGSTVVVDRQAGHQGHTFNLRGSSKALNALEEACEALWTPPPAPAASRKEAPEALPRRQTAEADGKGAAARAEPAPAPAPGLPEPDGVWTVEIAADRASARIAGEDGTDVTLTCAQRTGGRVGWVIDTATTFLVGDPIETFALSSGGSRVELEAIQMPSADLFAEQYIAPYDTARHLPVLRAMFAGGAVIELESADGVRMMSVPAAGASEALPAFFDACAAWEP